MLSEQEFTKHAQACFPSLVKTLFRYLDDWDDAEDCAQQALMKAWANRESFRGDSLFSTWLTRIGINTAYKLIDYNKRRPPKQDVVVEYGLDDEEIHFIDSETPESILIAAEKHEAMQQAYKELTPEQQEVVSMRDDLGMAYEDIAKSLEIPKGTVMSRLYRSRQKIKGEEE